MTGASVREICVLAVISGVTLTLVKSNTVRQLMQLLTAAVLMISVLSWVREADLDVYSLYTAKLNEAQQLTENAEMSGSRLTASVIQRRCEAYIMDKASALNTAIDKAEVEVQWSMDGLWVPYSVKISGERSELLSQAIAAELGIPALRQKWDQGDE